MINDDECYTSFFSTILVDDLRSVYFDIWHLDYKKNYSISTLEQSGVEVEYDVVQQQSWQYSVTGSDKGHFLLPNCGYADLFNSRSFCTYYRK